MTPSELAFLIGALCGSGLTWLFMHGVHVGDDAIWQSRCEDWQSRFVAVKQELDRLKKSGEEWKDNDHGRN